MAVVPKKMGLGLLTASDATQYTAAGAEVLSNILLTNVSTAPVKVSISVVPSGGAVGDGNRVVKNIEVPAEGVVQLETLRVVMATGDFISAVAATASAITMRSTGVSL